MPYSLPKHPPLFFSGGGAHRLETSKMFVSCDLAALSPRPKKIPVLVFLCLPFPPTQNASNKRAPSNVEIPFRKSAPPPRE